MIYLISRSYFINVLLIITHICANITLYVLSKFHEELPSNSKPADSDSRPTYHQQSSDLIRYVNMTTLLSRTASCHNAPLLQYSPGNDLQVDPETDCLKSPAMVERATILLVLRLTHCHRLNYVHVLLIIIFYLKHGVHYRHSPQGIDLQAPPSPTNCQHLPTVGVCHLPTPPLAYAPVCPKVYRPMQLLPVLSKSIFKTVQKSR